MLASLMLLWSTSTPYLAHATASALLRISSLPRRRSSDRQDRRSLPTLTNRSPFSSAEKAKAEIQPFNVLELIVVQIGRRDRPSRLKPNGWLAILWKTFFGVEQATRLADPRLEALRVLVIALGERHPRPATFKAALAAGITRQQLEFLVVR
jgi:hypothetical protein